MKDIRDAVQHARGGARAVGAAHDPLRRRSAPLQQGAAGCVPAVRRARPAHLHRRHHREPVVRGEQRAAVARRGLRARSRSSRTSLRCCSIARSRARCRTSTLAFDAARDAVIGYRRRRRAAAAQPARAARHRSRRKRASRHRSSPSSKRPLARSLRRFDKGGDAFYDQISALHKSVRGSRSRRRAVLAVPHARRRRRSALRRAAPGAHGERGHRARRSARAAHRARCVRDLRAARHARGRAGARRGGDLSRRARRRATRSTPRTMRRAHSSSRTARARCRCTSATRRRG